MEMFIISEEFLVGGIQTQVHSVGTSQNDVIRHLNKAGCDEFRTPSEDRNADRASNLASMIGYSLDQQEVICGFTREGDDASWESGMEMGTRDHVTITRVILSTCGIYRVSSKFLVVPPPVIQLAATAQTRKLLLIIDITPAYACTFNSLEAETLPPQPIVGQNKY